MEKINEATVVCNYPAYAGHYDYELNLFGEKKLDNVFPQISLFYEWFRDINVRLIDFIEIATFVYVADQSIVRCQDRIDPHGYLWNRKINMIIAVRDIDFWNNTENIATLERLLQFLSDDSFHFTFTKMTQEPPLQQYLIFDDNMGAPEKPERVMLFSGGLDSLGGAIESLLVDGKRTVMVRHKSATKHKKRYEYIESQLKRRSGDRAVFFTFKVGKDGSLSNEYTQRARSFLYFAFASVIANLLELHEVCFYENGPISINLPLSPQVIGGRATRTTHPQTLHYFQKLMRAVANDSEFIVSNPFIKKTKSEIIKDIINNDCSDLIKESMSCAHSWQQTNLVKHCGTCSQCIDRRVAIIAAEATEYDSEDDYQTDFFTQSVDRRENKQVDYFDVPNKNLLASYFLRASIMGQIKTVEDFQMRYPEISGALNYMGNSPDLAAVELFKLHKHLAGDIEKVIKYALDKYQIRMADVNNPLPDDSLLYLLTRKTRSVIHEVKEVPKKLPAYCLIRCGAIWKLCFNGSSERLLPDLDGCTLLAKLLQNSNTPVSYETLFPSEIGAGSISIDGDDIMNNMTISDKENRIPVIDEKTKAFLIANISECQQEMDIETCPVDRKEELEDQIEKIQKYLKNATGRSGKIRDFSKNGKRKSDRCRSLINTLLKHIEKFDHECAEHLRKNISYGVAPVYKNPDGIQWIVEFNS